MHTKNIILWNTNYGRIICNLKKIMKKRNITIYELSKIIDVKYDIIKKYCNNENSRYDVNILAKICFSLDCKIDELLQYSSK